MCGYNDWVLLEMEDLTMSVEEGVRSLDTGHAQHQEKHIECIPLCQTKHTRTSVSALQQTLSR
ncbi:hypothetical protein AV903_18315 [Erwinia tracheiphila]|uniref:Uncharacterized protein n=1 Tax=Erwinia tracheiphila TaxID=65700 RepID=A0A345CVS9_9GAMM|nr:hypothetical protein AV903_18315 [Erwinia tracheiphila]